MMTATTGTIQRQDTKTTAWSYASSYCGRINASTIVHYGNAPPFC